MSRDKSLAVFLSVFFGMAGIAILILAWTQSLALSERILTTSAGSTGLLLALVQTLVFKSVRTHASTQLAPVEARVEDIKSGVYTEPL